MIYNSIYIYNIDNYSRHILRLVLSTVLLIASQTSFAQDLKKPNIIIILADDLGWGDVGFHGSDIKTPNIDKLAREGVILDRYYTAPVCSPTRAGLLTGRYPNRFGLRQTVVPPWSSFGVNLAEEFLPVMLKEAGYRNRAILGKWHLGHAKQEYLPLQRGFTHFYGHYNGAIDYFSHKREGEPDWHNDEETSHDKGYSTDLLADEAVKCIGNYSKESPFFMYVAFNAPHGPLQAKEEDLLLYGFDKSKPAFGKLAAEEDANGYGAEGRGNTRRQTYAAMVTNLDRNIGRILAALKTAGIENNTLILFHSDNGAAPNEGGTSGELRGLKFEEWDGGVRAPAIVKWPAAFKGSRTVSQVMGYIDIAPTIREIVGIKTSPAQPYDGISMLSVWKGKQLSVDRSIYLGYGSIVTNQWKLVKANSGNEKMKAGEDQLFDMKKDPGEKNNILSSNEAIYKKLDAEVSVFDKIRSAYEVPPYGEGRKNFKAPKDWKIK